MGVDVFFTLSGFLITSLVVQERIRTDRVDLLAFYKRRALRLLPALSVVSLFGIGVAYFFSSRSTSLETQTQALGAAVYISNWLQIAGVVTGNNHLAVTWSLSVEDQFYVLWVPVLVLALTRIVNKRSLIATVAALASLSVLWSAFLASSPAGVGRAYYGTDSRAYGLLIGCVAGLLYSFGMVRLSARSTRILWTLCIPGAAFYIWLTALSLPYLEPSRAPSQLGGGALLNIAVAALILLVVTNRAGILGRVLSWRPLVWIGSISYGLYLWHGVLFYWLLYGQPISNFIPLVCLVSALSFLVAAASYYLIEKPFLRLKYAVKRSRRPLPAQSANTE